MSETVVHWFRQDLRLTDNPALAAAADTGRPVVALYVFDDRTPQGWAMGGASRWWLHYSLAALDASLQARGGRLVLRRGVAAEVVTTVAQEVGADAVFCTRRYEPFAVAEEADAKDRLAAADISLRRFGGGLLFEPEDIRTGGGGPYKVFTPFYKACLANGVQGEPKPEPARIPAPNDMPDGEPLGAFGLLPTKPDWSGGLADTWTPGEAGALSRLDDFLDAAAASYKADRDRPDRAGTSRLSPHLHLGEIGPRTVWARAELAIAGDSALETGVRAFQRELFWREFSSHLLFHFPDLPEAPWRENFSAFPWRNDEKALTAWQRGQTGYPIVDAGMRELWGTGWMHNRVRMVVASFLVKHLLQPWQAGEEWFWDTLVDADLANNAASWQWIAGSGADAAPFFRIFNPMTQGGKFDPDGAYVRRWVPELANLPDKHIHEPWSAPEEVLKTAGVRLGGTYPEPIVDHKSARERALAAFDGIKG